LVFIGLAALAVATAAESEEIPASRAAEYHVLVLASVVAMCICAGSTDLLLSFLCLQAVGVLGFFLAGYNKRSARSTEASVKYMLFSVVSGGLLLYGLALLFVSTHSLNLEEIHKALLVTPLPRSEALTIFGLVFLALAVQIAAFPMHLWAPDVLDGAPTPAAAFLSFGARAAGFSVLLRFVMMVFAQPGPTGHGQWQVLGALDWTRFLAIIAGASMLVGAFLAHRQQSAKRLVGSLMIAQSGFLLLGVLVLDQVGVAAILYNFVIELFALMGCFAVLSVFVDELKSDRLEDFSGLLWGAIPECICLVLCLLCLVGVPPLPGFIGKFALIGAAVRRGHSVLAVIAVFAAALSTLSVARVGFSVMGDLRSPMGIRAGAVVAATSSRKALLFCMMIPLLLIGVFAEFFLSWASQSLGFILW
jgi:NADH-quinone oxidoreductase subunit N